MMILFLFLFLLIIGCVALLLNTQPHSSYTQTERHILVPSCCEMVQCGIIPFENEQEPMQNDTPKQEVYHPHCIADEEQWIGQDVSLEQEYDDQEYDLYDSMRQQLFAASMHLGTARVLLHQDSDAAAANVDKAEKILCQMQQELLACG